MNKTTAEREEAVAALRAAIKPGDTVYTILRHVSRSGRQRVIDVYTIKDNQPVCWSWTAAQACGFNYDRNHEGIKVGGCGMDMGFHLVYSMGRSLFPDGFAPSEKAIRPSDGATVNVNIGRGKDAGPLSRKEVASLVGRGWKFTGGRNGDTSGWDNDGGYALEHRWL